MNDMYRVCLLLAILTLAPTAALAQQVAPKKEEAQKQTGATPAKKEEAPPARTEESPAKAESAQKQTEEAQTKPEDDPKLTPVPGGKALGMSILGNQEAPKALVIVPWKSSELGNGPSVSTILDDSRSPIDKEVFMRMLSYYETSSETARSVGAPTNGNTAAPATAAQRRKP